MERSLVAFKNINFSEFIIMYIKYATLGTLLTDYMKKFSIIYLEC